MCLCICYKQKHESKESGTENRHKNGTVEGADAPKIGYNSYVHSPAPTPSPAGAQELMGGPLAGCTDDGPEHMYHHAELSASLDVQELSRQALGFSRKL